MSSKFTITQGITFIVMYFLIQSNFINDFLNNLIGFNMNQNNITMNNMAENILLPFISIDGSLSKVFLVFGVFFSILGIYKILVEIDDYSNIDYKKIEHSHLGDLNIVPDKIEEVKKQKDKIKLSFMEMLFYSEKVK